MFRPDGLRSDFAGCKATYLLAGERYLHLPNSQLRVRITADRIEIATDRFARQVTLEMVGVTGTVFEDNYFDLAPGESRVISLLQPAGGRQLRVRALNAAETLAPVVAAAGGSGV